MKVKELQIFGTKVLAGAVMQADYESDSLLSFVLGKPRSWLYGHSEESVPKSQAEKYKKLIRRRKSKEPFAYLTGETEFYGLPVKVNKDVLIPRPETENLVDIALELIKNNKIKTVVDVGTGSGAIILACAKLSNKACFGLDISEKALRVARKNARNLKIKKVKFFKSNLLNNLPKPVKHPVLFTANLPYLDKNEIKSRELSHEPKLALSGGDDGLKLIIKLVDQFKEKGRAGDFMVLEVGFRHELKLRKILKGLRYEALKDFNGVKRFVIVALDK